MKTIGMIGGMSWESTATYYRLINEGVKEQLGGLCSAKILLYSVNFAEIEELQHSSRWDEAAGVLIGIARRLVQAGADYIMICTNTMHLVADRVEAGINVPLLHIGDATAERIIGDKLSTVGLLGTRFTMELDFYRGRLQDRHGLKVITPDSHDRRIVDEVIYQELCCGEIRDESRAEYARITAGLVRMGAEAVILGCTEISLLLGPEDTGVVLYDTTELHAQQAVKACLS